MKKIFAYAVVVCLVFASVPFAVSATDEMRDSGLDYTESTAMIKNPFMGYPNGGYASDGGFLLLEGGTSTVHIDGSREGGFSWYYIDLKAFSAGNDGGAGGVAPSVVGGTDKPVSQAALDGFEQALLKMRRNGGSVFIRFVYDTNGVSGCEPNNFDMVITHLEQLCAVVSRYPDVVQGFECGIIGQFGEMHSSKYVGKEYANRVIDTYLNNTPDSMVLLLRTPGRIADYLGISKEALAALVPEKGSRAYRLGLYNDGYMNSNSDLGTWSNRAQEINYLAQGNTPYGGEYGSDYGYIISSGATVQLPENAIPEMYKTHVSFIRGNVYKLSGTNPHFGYDSYTYGAQYEKPGFPNNSAFYGVDCHTFITSHLGYRLVLRKSRLSQAPQAGGILQLQGEIENTGFANVLHNPAAEVLLVKDGAVYTCGVNLDASDMKSCKTHPYNFSLSLPSNLVAGNYDVYLRLAHGGDSFYARTKSGIRFANNGGIYNANLGANKLGAVTIAPAANAGSAVGDVFAQVNAPQAGASVHQGAPALLGHGFSVTGSLPLSFNTGDSMALSPLNFLRSDAAATYQWVKDGTPVSSQKEFSIAALQLSDAGAYKLTVTSGSSFTTMTVNVAVTDHNFGGWATTAQPTCSATGLAKRTCTDGGCGLVETKILPALEHLAGGAPRTIQPTCAKLGRVEQPCARCGETLSFTLLDLPKLPHMLGDFTVVTSPTCMQEGLLMRGCADCDYTETKPMNAQHPFDITIDGDTVSGLCPLCGATFGPKSFAGTLPPGEAIDTPAVPFGTDQLVMVGPDGFVSEYRPKTDNRNITFLFEMTGVETPVALAKFRTISFTKDVYAIWDSNNAPNYYGECKYPVTQDGVWAFTISRSVMSHGNSSYFGGIDWAAFSDPLSTKGTANPVNNNADATFQMLGIYDGSLAYDIVYVDVNGDFLERHNGEYNGAGEGGEANKWVNLIANVKSAGELYQGASPVKPSDGSFSYTFAGWVDITDNPLGAVITDVIAYPSFTPVPLGPTDAQAVAEAKAALTWNSIRNANTTQGNVATKLVTLPLVGAGGVTISWSSNNTAVSNTGIVTRPAYGSGNAVVKLTATIMKGSASDKVVFNLTVLELPQSDTQAVAAAKAALTWNSIRNTNTVQNSVTANLVTLPLNGANGAAISWSSNNAAVSNKGIVTRPAYGSGNTAVKLTATITKGSASDKVEFNLTVLERMQTTPTIPPEIVINKNFDVLNVRQTGKITAQSATGYQSGNNRVATIDQQGNILGKRPGTAVITVQTTSGTSNITVAVKYSFVQWLLVIFAFGWIWLPLK